MLSISPPPALRHLYAIVVDVRLEIPPLDAKRFNGSFKHFCSVKGLAPEKESSQVGGREVNLHSLHVEVMKRRGYIADEVPDSSPSNILHPNMGAERFFFCLFRGGRVSGWK